MPPRKTKNTGWVCYILREATGKATYVGATVNFPRRLRQHNGGICGGARYTRKHKGKWEGVCYVAGFRNQREALQFEWAVKHEAPRHLHGLKGRLTKLQKVLSKERWTSQAPPATEVSLCVHWLIPEIRPENFSYPTCVSESFAGCNSEEEAGGSESGMTGVDCGEDEMKEVVMRVEALGAEISCPEGINVGGDESEDDIPLVQLAARMQKPKSAIVGKSLKSKKTVGKNVGVGQGKKTNAESVEVYFGKRKAGRSVANGGKRAKIDCSAQSVITEVIVIA